MERYIDCRSCQNTHLHEVQGSVMIAEERGDAHNHRFAAISDKAIPVGRCDHVHEVVFRTDSYEGHYHEFSGRTSGAYAVGDGHVHYLKDDTTSCNGHKHCFKLITHIDNPIGD